MKRFFRYSSLALVISASISASQAAMHPESFGVYSTAVQEDRLFIDDGTVLRCDLLFTSADKSQVVAPKGSRVSQSLPPFVWQYSGLLPVSDYLKTAAIHSYSSDIKERAWQDVQSTFYDGLRSEGAREFEAKVAFAGAYAFAPRWPLVELIDITDAERDKQTRLYRVEYIPAAVKGVSIEEYRTLVKDIVKNSDKVSLQDIRGIIDAADAAKAAADDDGWLKKIWRNESAGSDKKGMRHADETETDLKPSAGNNLGALFASEKPTAKAPMKTIPADPEDIFNTEKPVMDKEIPAEELPELPPELPVDSLEKAEPTGVMVPIPELASLDTQLQGTTVEVPEQETETPQVEIRQVQLMPVIVADPNSVSDQLAIADQQVLQAAEPAAQSETQVIGEEGVVVDLDSVIIDENEPQSLFDEEEEIDPEPPVEVDRWRVLPDGSEVLEN